MLKIYRYQALAPGPTLAIFGAVHGDEKSGTQALLKLIDELECGALQLKRGSIMCVPICNPRAYAQNVRFCERNLNRAMYVKDSPQAYEDHIDPILCRILGEADALLDLHSYASEGKAFCFLGHGSAAELDYCLALGIDDFVYGWSEAFGLSGDGDPRESMGTVEYARTVGCLATTVESGHHHNDDIVQIAYRSITRALTHFDMADICRPQAISQKRFVKMKSVFYKAKEGVTAKPWKHYDAVTAGELLAEYDDGEKILAPEDGVIVLPKLHAAVGGEWFYFGVQTQCPRVQAPSY